MNGISIFAFGFAAGALSFAALSLWTSTPREQDWAPDTGELLPDEFNATSPASRMVIGGSPTGGAMPATFIQDEGAGRLGGCSPAAPVGIGRGRLRLVIDN